LAKKRVGNGISSSTAGQNIVPLNNPWLWEDFMLDKLDAIKAKFDNLGVTHQSGDCE
jgi:hypothetical protein